MLDVLRKSLCTIVAVMAEAVEGWCCFFPLAPQGLSLCDGSWKRRGSEWSAVDTREPADIPKLYLSHHTTVLSLEAAPTQLCPLCLIMSPNCLHINYNMRRLEVLDNALHLDRPVLAFSAHFFHCFACLVLMGFLSVFVAVSASKLDCKTIFPWVKNVYIDLLHFP